MAKLTKFTSLGVLQNFSVPVLIEFLNRFKAYLKARKIKLSAETFDYEEIISLFTQVHSDTPQELLEAAFFIEEMASQSGRDKVIKEANARNIILGYAPDAFSVHDFIMLTWLRHPGLLEAAKSRVQTWRKRSFCTCSPTLGEVHPLVRSEIGSIHDLEQGLADVLPGCDSGAVKVIEYEDKGTDEIWFLVRRTGFLERVPFMGDSGTPEVVFVRPLKYDVIVYDKAHGTLRINCHKSLRGEYRQEFGQFLFGKQEYFADRDVYSLNILFDNDPAFLDCSGIAGIDSIRWKEVGYVFPGSFGITRVEKSPDMAKSKKLRNKPFVPPGVVIRYAKFDVLFEGAKSPRSVQIMAGNVANYSRESDYSALDDWIRQSGIMINLVQQVAHAA
ncbi:hypothetical protein [Tichowtungia aerotolerans]|uniref:Uncharacterized protein n=1 Tax=Tichowtungia aerotolerans TaxID=2697043 RepID=A0A6P1MBL9_9BACT|nr:hypothetical protein [Tichowtungia aerotolerans]QHI70493.1 hypothetical protein GT409_13940 [Tichowtungia aerotolerans]